VLFTDLVRSTELMAGLGDTAFDRIRGEHFARLELAITKHGGVALKTTGDGVLASFASAVDALEAAVAVQQTTEAQRQAVDAPISIRVGLAIGEVSFEKGDVFGTPVVEAARLMALAGPGQILCTALVRAMAGSRAEVAMTDVGLLELKGLPGPIPACEVAWEPLPPAVASVPLHDVQGCFEGVVPAVLATCSADGTPNITFISQIYLVDEDHVAASNQFFAKTSRNLAENPSACALVIEPGSFDVYKLQLRFQRTARRGTVFEQLRRSIDAMAALTGMEHVFRLRGADLYEVTTCEQIGETGPA
jgi:hypothetical protein